MKINEYTSSLGDTAEEVAESLRKQGAKGAPNDTRANPVIAGIHLHCNTWSGLKLGIRKGGVPSGWFTFNDDQICDPSAPPLAVVNFLIRFNEGEFSDLVDPSLLRMKSSYDRADWLYLDATRRRADAAAILRGY
jgi:hypothetical protein